MTPENNNTVTQREHPAFEDDYTKRKGLPAIDQWQAVKKLFNKS